MRRTIRFAARFALAASLALLICLPSSGAGISAKLVRYVDVSQTQITFVFGGDIWVMPKKGGQAVRLTSSPGEESWPRFSPDGQHIGYTASYAGNEDVYVLPVAGGVPTRVTWNSFPDRMVDWHPDGERLLFASRRELGQRGSRQFFLVDREGGMAQRLPVPYGELASFSPDGSTLAYITKITENYPFKRYRGGLTSDIILYDLANRSARRITDDPATDGKPAWSGDAIYYLSDQGPALRLNVWRYDTRTQTHEQLTRFQDFDVSYMAAGATDVVFEAGGVLYLMDATQETYQPIEVEVVSDLTAEMPRTVDVTEHITNMTASPGGKRVVFEARGELFDVPVERGYSINLTRSSGAFDQQPAWSPDGKHIAYWSDASGEYEIHLRAADGSAGSRQLTKRNKGYGFTLHWSPDSKHIAFLDHTNTINLVALADGTVKKVGHTNWQIWHGERYAYPIAWSPDARWLAFTQGLENAHFAVFLYDTKTGELHQVTSGFYGDAHPAFSRDGKHLFYLTNRHHAAAYSDLGDGTWIYPNATQIASVSLTDEIPSLLQPRNDAMELGDESGDGESSAEGAGTEADAGDAAESQQDEQITVDITTEGFESRLTLLPPAPGNIAALFPFEGKLVYLRGANTGTPAPGTTSIFPGPEGKPGFAMGFGANGPPGTLMRYDFESREEKMVLDGVLAAVMTADGEALLVRTKDSFAIVKPEPEQKIEQAIPATGLEMNLIPREEWRQIFADTWRRHRDFFYDPDMHQLDWAALRNRYAPLIEHARTRWDVTNVQSNLAAELSAGHTYTRGGDVEQVTARETGFLGIDWESDAKGYRVGRVVRPAAWDTGVRSPFDRPGIEVSAGDYILSVNGVPLSRDRDPYAPFDGLAGKTVRLKISSTGKADDARTVTIVCLAQGEEQELRHLEWMEQNRQRVDVLSGGKLGYVYMSNTATKGQLELVRMYYGQLDREGFIIDERFNGGGQLADRFMELLLRTVPYNIHWRDGRDHTWPAKANRGPMGMLINGWAGSGGDGLPWAFKELGAGPLVGERTLGILIGPATGHTLIDGGFITVPDARLYGNDGEWFWEGEGVRPDIPVWDDPTLLSRGRDPQLERVVTEVMKLLPDAPPAITPAPPREDRTARGLRETVERR